MDSSLKCRFLPLPLLLLPIGSFLLACSLSAASDPVVQKDAQATVESEEAAAEVKGEESNEKVEEGQGSAANCAGGVVKDDGTVETGYGFVPQATEGVYVQEFHSKEFSSRSMESVCVCWLKTRHSPDIDFEVVFYEPAGSVPASEPYAKVPGAAKGVPNSVKAAGAFFEVDVSGVSIPEGTSYIGVRWNPSEAKFLFLCTDRGEESAKTNVFFREDQAPSWTNVFASSDPIFFNHRSVLLRAKAEAVKKEAPAEMHDQ